jgi:hypothetical protein
MCTKLHIQGRLYRGGRRERRAPGRGDRERVREIENLNVKRGLRGKNKKLHSEDKLKSY